MKLPLLIYGAGGLGREVLSLVRAVGNFEVIGFLDDGVSKGTVVKGVTVLGGLAGLQSAGHPINVVVAIGDPATRAAIVQKINIPEVQYPVIKHPSAIVQDESVTLGEGSIVCAGSMLTTDIRVGAHVLINLNCTVGHDTMIGDYASLMPGVNVAGNVVIGKEVLIGSGANILNGVRVGDHSTVGMGCVVIRDVQDRVKVAGVPAKRIGKGVGDERI